MKKVRTKHYLGNGARLLFASLLLFTAGCSAEKENQEISFAEKKVEEVSLLIEADSSEQVTIPTMIKSADNGFFVYDEGPQELVLLNKEGNKKFSLGRRGNGPGEYRYVGDFWKFNDTLLVHDINGRKLISYDSSGASGKDISLDFLDFSGRPAEIEAISTNRFFMASNGKNGSLLTMVDIPSERTDYIGTAIENTADPQKLQSNEERQQAISSGNIPVAHKNDVFLTSNETGLFSFQQSTGLLEKYDDAGKLLWQKNIKVPAIQGLFEKLLEENQARIKGEEMLLSFSYADGISANTKGVAVKLNLFEDEPIKIVWVSNKGEDLTVVTFPELKNSSSVPIGFTLSADGSHILFLDMLEGEVYRGEWPL